MTKPIIVVKICYKLLYVIQAVKRFLISNFLASVDIKVFGRTSPIYNATSDWPHTFLYPRCFCLAYLYIHIYHMHVQKKFAYIVTTKMSKQNLCLSRDISDNIVWKSSDY